MLIFNVPLPLCAKEYGTAVLPLAFTLGTLSSSSAAEGRALGCPQHSPVQSGHNQGRTRLNTVTNPRSSHQHRCCRPEV